MHTICTFYEDFKIIRWKSEKEKLTDLSILNWKEGKRSDLTEVLGGGIPGRKRSKVEGNLWVMGVDQDWEK